MKQLGRSSAAQVKDTVLVMKASAAEVFVSYFQKVGDARLKLYENGFLTEGEACGVWHACFCGLSIGQLPELYGVRFESKAFEALCVNCSGLVVGVREERRSNRRNYPCTVRFVGRACGRVSESRAPECE